MEKKRDHPIREISFESETVSKTDPKVQFTMDASLTAGSVSVTQSGQSGCIAQLWKIVKVDGKQQSRDLFNKSNYQATPKLITIGTKDATSETLSALKAAITIGDEAKVRSAAAGLKTTRKRKKKSRKKKKRRTIPIKRRTQTRAIRTRKRIPPKRMKIIKRKIQRRKIPKNRIPRKKQHLQQIHPRKKHNRPKKANRK